MHDTGLDRALSSRMRVRHRSQRVAPQPSRTRAVTAERLTDDLADLTDLDEEPVVPEPGGDVSQRRPRTQGRDLLRQAGG